LLEGPRGGVFYLFGDDDFRKDRAARSLVAHHLDEATGDFNYDPLCGPDVDIETLASVLATPPMMAEWRVVLLREVEALASSSKARDVLLKVAKSPPAGLALVLVASEPARSKAKFYVELKKVARAIEFSSISMNDAPGWLIHWADREYGFDLTPEAARALASAVGTNLGILDQEIAKLQGMADDEGQVGLAQVEAAGTKLPRVDRWQWFDLVGERRFAEARADLEVLLGHGESGVGLVIGLGTHLLRLGLLVTGGAPALERALPRHQRWLMRRLRDQGRRWTEADVEHALVSLARVDRLLKSASFSEVHLLEEWLLAQMARTARVA
jgi:DNA polymerase III delta subunit